MPLGVLEAMATGVPVIASDVPGNMCLIRDGVTGLIARAADPVAFADAIERLALDAPLRRRLRAAGLQKVQTHTWEMTTRLTLLALERAIAGRSSGDRR
jgi:glycosyltransferase involved in cell wall biosynthesis